MLLDLAAAQRAISEPKYRLQDYTAITSEAARALARCYRHRISNDSELDGRGEMATASTLCLASLESLELEAATALADWAGESGTFLMTLDLSGLRALPRPVAAALAVWRPAMELEDGGCTLLLDGVTEAQPDALAVLAGWKPECLSATLSLQGLASLDAAQAKAIRAWAAPAAHCSLFDRKSDAEPIHGPFCDEEVDALVNRNADTWAKQWQHRPCPHVVSTLSNGQPALMIPGVTRQRATAPGRLRLNACLQGNEIVHEFAPRHPL
jgi:hypothetical protein